MKNVILTIAMTLAVGDVAAQGFKAEKSTIDLKKISYKQPATVRFQLKNTSSQALRIEDVRTNCGCTVASFPKQAIAAGQQATIMATYDARQMGHFDKVLGVYVKGEEKPMLLHLKGIVVEKAPKPVVAVKAKLHQGVDQKTKKKRDKLSKKREKQAQKERERLEKQRRSERKRLEKQRQAERNQYNPHVMYPTETDMKPAAQQKRERNMEK